MKLNEYQELALRTAPGLERNERNMLYGALCGCEEAGEFAGVIKKALFHGHPLDRDKAIKELGDELWYAAYRAYQLGTTLEEVAVTNIEKLRQRYPFGFTTADSINRKDT